MRLVSLNKNLRDKWNLLPVISIDHIREKFDNNFVKLFLLLLSLISQFLPQKFMIAFPKRFALVFGLLAKEGKRCEKSIDWLNIASKHELTRDLAVYHSLDFFGKKRDSNNLMCLINECISEVGLKRGNIISMISWAHFNLGFEQYYILFDKIIQLLESEDLKNPTNNLRLLPYHANYIGHIGFLQKYISYYAEIDKDRVIGIWPDSSVNRYYLEKVLNWSPLKIHIFDGQPPRVFEDPRSVDFMYSRVNENKWRVDLASGSFREQNYPEANPPSSHFLEITESEDARAENLCKSIGLNPTKWFVCLHVRQGPAGFIKDVNRDADIHTYRDFCKQVLEMGGQVVRMGDPSFPKLPTNFPAIDYAHSTFRSAFFDTWLWGRCRWWTGTNIGPSVVAMTFGKPRLMTDTWLWEGVGQANDLWMPKLLVNKEFGRILTPYETIQNAASRAVSKDALASKKLALRSNSASELREAAVEMFERTLPGSYSNSLPTQLEKHYARVMRIPDNSPHNRFPKYFASQWELLLPDNFLENSSEN